MDNTYRELKIPEHICRESSYEKTPRKPFKFNRTVNILIDNLRWVNTLVTSTNEHMKELVTSEDPFKFKQKEDNLFPNFNLNKFKADIKASGKLSDRAKDILSRDPEERTEEEVRQLYDLVNRISFFQKYPYEVRYELSKSLTYLSFEKDRVILKQGDQAVNFYFIISGSVLVEVSEEDAETNTKTTRIVQELRAGSSFGELALLHECKRRATIVSKEESAFLIIDKEDFERVIRTTIEKDWNLKYNFFKHLKYTKEWSETKIKGITEASSLIEFRPNSVLFEDFGNKETIYFIANGKCRVIQSIQLWEKRLTKGYKKYSLTRSKSNPSIHDELNSSKDKESYSNSTFNSQISTKEYSRKVIKRHEAIFSSPPLSMQTHVWALAQLKAGDFFGIGENLKEAKIVAEGKVVLIAVPSMALINNEYGCSLESMLNDIMKLYPDPEVAIESYNAHKKWETYKKKVVQEVLERRGK